MKVSDSHIKYAKAIFNLASRKGIEEKVLKQLGELAEFYNDEKFFTLIKSLTFLEASVGQKLLKEVFEKNLEPTVFNLIILLFQNRRLTLLPRINQNYRKIYHHNKGIADITLITAREISNDEKAAYEKLLTSKRNTKISVTYEVNPALIGGVQYYEGGYLTDLSIRNYLQSLEKHLISKEIN